MKEEVEHLHSGKEKRDESKDEFFEKRISPSNYLKIRLLKLYRSLYLTRSSFLAQLKMSNRTMNAYD